MAGPQAGPIQFYYAGLLPMIKSLTLLQGKLEKPDLAPLVRGAGKVWQQNFKAEGWLASRGWRPLSEYTQNIREFRGYNPSHPILEQSGGLRRAAADYPAEMKNNARSMNRTTSTGGANTTVTARMTDTKVTLTLSGEKVKNNFGGEVMGTGWTTTETHALPARRFWFVSPEVQSQMLEEFMTEVSKLI